MRRISLLLMISLLLAACTLAAPEPASSAVQPTVDETAAAEEIGEVYEEIKPLSQVTPRPLPTRQPMPELPKDRIPIRWFVGLGAGSDPEQLESQQAVVERFNKSQETIQLVLEVVPNDTAAEMLQAALDSDDPPDIVGPVSVRGANGGAPEQRFSGRWLDLTALLQKAGYDLTQFDAGVVDFYRVGESQTAIPFSVSPSFLYYNKDLFDRAKLAYPPHKVGEKYMLDSKPVEWDIDTLSEVARRLTLDANGHPAASPDFDPGTIAQFGFIAQWTDLRGQASLFGAGSFVDADGKTAVLPEHWKAAIHWYYDGMWRDHFIPNNFDLAGELFAAGSPFASGKVGMAFSPLWYTCCFTKQEAPHWDIAVLPSYNGQVTAKLYAETFYILKSTRYPEQAFQALTYLVGEASPTLLELYGGLPARKTAQAAYFDSLQAQYAPNQIDWQVVMDMLHYADNPSHESDMPNFAAADDRISAFQTLYQSTDDLNLDKELRRLVSDLQKIFARK